MNPIDKALYRMDRRRSEMRASNRPEWDETLSFLQGQYQPQVSPEMGALARLAEYAKEDVSDVADFFVGGLAKYANQANFNQDHGVMDTVVAGLEAGPIGAAALPATRGLAKLSSMGAENLMKRPGRAGFGQGGAVGLPMDEASRMDRRLIPIPAGLLGLGLMDDETY